MGPNGEWTKIGMTGGSLGDRILGLIGSKQMPEKFSLETSQVWAAQTPSRYEAEAAAHQLLVDYRIHPSLKLGRELFRADLPTVLNAIKLATKSDPMHFEWDFSKWFLTLKNDPFPQEDRGVRISNPPEGEHVPTTRRVVRAWVVSPTAANA